MLEWQYGALSYEGQHGAHEGPEGAWQHGAHKRQHGAVPC